MTELQEVELELLRQFLAVCGQEGLTYYMVCGSALGAVKYGGFIPWDDDIDVALPRPDYERFCRAAPSLLPDWCFLQNYRTEPLYYRLGSKLRDSRTTYMEAMADRLNIHHGVFIDIFPLDVQWNTRSEEREFRRRLADFEAARRVRLHYRRLSPANLPMVRTNLYRALFLLSGRRGDTAAEAEAFDSYISSFSPEGSSVWCNHANSTSPTEYAPREQYGSGVPFPFEGLTVRVPSQYDAYLTQKYGDWRSDPPPEERVGHHACAVCDLRRPYTEYMTAGRRGSGRKGGKECSP